jgi:phage terminase small subunit
VQSAKGMNDKKTAMLSMGMNMGMNPMSESKIFSSDSSKKAENPKKSK